jgi:hypothetical protein
MTQTRTPGEELFRITPQRSLVAGRHEQRHVPAKPGHSSSDGCHNKATAAEHGLSVHWRCARDRQRGRNARAAIVRVSALPIGSTELPSTYPRGALCMQRISATLTRGCIALHVDGVHSMTIVKATAWAGSSTNSLADPGGASSSMSRATVKASAGLLQLDPGVNASRYEA